MKSYSKLLTLILFISICIFEVKFHTPLLRGIDSMFMIKINRYFSKTILGEIAFRDRGSDIFYEAHLEEINPNETIILRDEVDIKTFREVKIVNFDNNCLYEDYNNEYILRTDNEGYETFTYRHSEKYHLLDSVMKSKKK